MRWSPEQISGWLSEQGIKLSHERIYQMIWDDKRDGGNLWRSLRRRGKRYNRRAGKNAGRGLIPNKIDISERPAIVARKTRLGDWEGDTVVTPDQRRLAHAGRAQNQLAKITKCRVRPPARHKRLPCVASSLSATSCTPSRQRNGIRRASGHRPCLKSKIFFATPFHALNLPRFMRPASGGLYGQARTANHPQNRRTMSTRQLVEPARPVV